MTENFGLNIPGHGWFQTNAKNLDILLMKHMPATAEELRAFIRGNITMMEGAEDAKRYDDLRTVTECLLVIAQLTGLAT